MEIIRAEALSEADREADFSFEIDHVVTEPFHAVPLRVAPSAPRTKNHGLDGGLFEHFDGTERVLFVAREAGDLAGYLAASRGWNGCSVIDDFAIARRFRRRGLSTALMRAAVDWTREAGLGMIRLETQSSNVVACKFYQRFGFVLGGYDRLLYHELDADMSDEVALFWYLDIGSRQRVTGLSRPPPRHG